MDQNPSAQNQQVPQPAPAQPAQAPVQNYQQYNAPVTSNGSGFAIAALVLGIIAFLFGWLGFFNLITAILAVVFGIIALKKGQSKGMAVTGLALGAVGLLASIVFAIFQIVAFTNNDLDTGSSSSNSSSIDSAIIE